MLGQPSLSLSLKLMIHYQRESIASQAMERLLVKDQTAKVVFSTGCLGQLITHVRHDWWFFFFFFLTRQVDCKNTDELFPIPGACFLLHLWVKPVPGHVSDL